MTKPPTELSVGLFSDRPVRTPASPPDDHKLPKRPAVKSDRGAVLVSRSQSLVRFASSRAGGIVLIVATAVVFSLASLGLSSSATRQYRATATVLVQPDPSLAGLTPDPQADGSDRFDQGQIIAMQKLVENALPTQKPSGLAAISISQVGLTDVLQITASAPAAPDAVASANLLLDDYVSGRRQALNKHIKSAVTEIDHQLTTITRALRPVHGAKPGTSSKAVTAGLTAEYGRLLSLRNQIKMVAVTSTTTTVLSRASSTDVSVADNKSRNALLVGLLGALVATGAWLLRQRLAIGQALRSHLSTSQQ